MKKLGALLVILSVCMFGIVGCGEDNSKPITTDAAEGVGADDTTEGDTTEGDTTEGDTTEGDTTEDETTE